MHKLQIGRVDGFRLRCGRRDEIRSQRSGRYCLGWEGCNHQRGLLLLRHLAFEPDRGRRNRPWQ